MSPATEYGANSLAEEEPYAAPAAEDVAGQVAINKAEAMQAKAADLRKMDFTVIFVELFYGYIQVDVNGRYLFYTISDFFIFI